MELVQDNAIHSDTQTGAGASTPPRALSATSFLESYSPLRGEVQAQEEGDDASDEDVQVFADARTNTNFLACFLFDITGHIHEIFGPGWRSDESDAYQSLDSALGQYLTLPQDLETNPTDSLEDDTVGETAVNVLATPHSPSHTIASAPAPSENELDENSPAGFVASSQEDNDVIESVNADTAEPTGTSQEDLEPVQTNVENNPPLPSEPPSAQPIYEELGHSDDDRAQANLHDYTYDPDYGVQPLGQDYYFPQYANDNNPENVSDATKQLRANFDFLDRDLNPADFHPSVFDQDYIPDPIFNGALPSNNSQILNDANLDNLFPDEAWMNANGIASFDDVIQPSALAVDIASSGMAIPGYDPVYENGQDVRTNLQSAVQQNILSNFNSSAWAVDRSQEMQGGQPNAAQPVLYSQHHATPTSLHAAQTSTALQHFGGYNQGDSTQAYGAGPYRTGIQSTGFDGNASVGSQSSVNLLSGNLSFDTRFYSNQSYDTRSYDAQSRGTPSYGNRFQNTLQAPPHGSGSDFNAHRAPHTQPNRSITDASAFGNPALDTRYNSASSNSQSYGLNRTGPRSSQSNDFHANFRRPPGQLFGTPASRRAESAFVDGFAPSRGPTIPDYSPAPPLPPPRKILPSQGLLSTTRATARGDDGASRVRPLYDPFQAYPDPPYCKCGSQKRLGPYMSICVCTELGHNRQRSRVWHEICIYPGYAPDASAEEWECPQCKLGDLADDESQVAPQTRRQTSRTKSVPRSNSAERDYGADRPRKRKRPATAPTQPQANDDDTIDEEPSPPKKRKASVRDNDGDDDVNDGDFKDDDGDKKRPKSGLRKRKRTPYQDDDDSEDDADTQSKKKKKKRISLGQRTFRPTKNASRSTTTARSSVAPSTALQSTDPSIAPAQPLSVPSGASAATSMTSATSATPAPSTTRGKTSSYSAQEDVDCMKILPAIKLDPTENIPRIDDLWRRTSEEMIKLGHNRTAASVKNQWNRRLRGLSGFDERQTPREDAMRTGLLGVGEAGKVGRISKKKTKVESSDSDDTNSKKSKKRKRNDQDEQPDDSDDSNSKKQKKTKRTVQEEQPDDQEEQPVDQEEQPVDQEAQPNDQDEQPNDQDEQPNDQHEQPVDEEEQPNDQDEQLDEQQAQPEDQEEQPVNQEEQ